MPQRVYAKTFSLFQYKCKMVMFEALHGIKHMQFSFRYIGDMFLKCIMCVKDDASIYVLLN